jgi:hypothetical protein
MRSFIIFVRESGLHIKSYEISTSTSHHYSKTCTLPSAHMEEKRMSTDRLEVYLLRWALRVNALARL